jgi:hypothetical protein
MLFMAGLLGPAGPARAAEVDSFRLSQVCAIHPAFNAFVEVLDANGTDANGASFQLPNPDPDNDGITEYSVWARALGKPGGSSTTTTCAYDLAGELWCSVYTMVLVRDKGRANSKT